MSSSLPKSPRIAVGEAVAAKVSDILSVYNDGADPGIVIRGWDDSLKKFIDEKLSKLGVCVLVCAPRRKPAQEHRPDFATLTIKIVIETTPVMKTRQGDQIRDWDADDIADLLADRLGKWVPVELPQMIPSVTDVESTRVAFTNKSTTLTLELKKILTYGF